MKKFIEKTFFLLIGMITMILMFIFMDYFINNKCITGILAAILLGIFTLGVLKVTEE